MPPVPPPPVVQAAPDPAEPQPVDWRSIPPDEIMVMRLADGHEVLIRLAARMVPRHIENIRRLIAARWWDGLSIYRVQENWVAQWGDRTEKRPLPPGTAARVAPEFELATPPAVTPMVRPDAYSTWSGVTADGWPVAGDGRAAWLVHCYGSVGVARDDAPDSGNGAELFTPIGRGGARRLDRNYAVVGRVMEGMQYLSALPRSDASDGVYADVGRDKGIAWVRLASDLPAADRPRLEYRTADNPRYAAMIAKRERPAPPTVAVGAGVCDLPVGVRRAP